jgi:hypothetical protein
VIWFEAALAFALTMLIFATMVSVIVEAGMRIFLARESGFQRMLEQLFDEMIKPRITDLLERLADTQVGQEIAKQTEDRMDILVKDMAQKFESVGAAATETYTRRAATISMLTAMYAC